MLTRRLPVMTQELPSTRSSFVSQTRASGLSGSAWPVRKSSATIEKEDDMTGATPFIRARNFART